MTKKITCGIFLVLMMASCTKTDITEKAVVEEPLLTARQIDDIIWKTVQQQHQFNWNAAGEAVIWSALQQSDGMLSIGYSIWGKESIDDRMATIDINADAWTKEKDRLQQLILQSERKIHPEVTLQEIFPWEEKVLPVIDAYVRNRETLKLLLADKQLRYAEPMGYEPEVDMGLSREPVTTDQATSSSSGCGSNTAQTGLVANVDYSLLTPNAMQSWNHGYHNIGKAWTKSTGTGTKVFVIDTGCEYDQENLGSAFNQGSSAGRTVEKIVTLPRSTFLGIPTGSVEIPDDGCGHGTAMAGACAAPRGTDGNAAGVAYNCNLVTCRAAEDVFLDDSREVKGASDAYTNAANRADVRIISMSMGRITSSSQLRDAIVYAYGKNKLMFCAAGTSFSWASGWWGVIFPATLTQVNAVTGVKSGNFNTACSDCHDGSETDFTIVMERTGDGRTPLTLAMRGDVPSTVGGSSVATATAAGIAALVWSRYPTYTRDQIQTKLVQSSANYPTRNGSLGWGNLNADAATN